MNLRVQLEELLSNYNFDEKCKKYIWGAGNTAVLYQEGLRRLKNFEVEAYIDTNPEKQGKGFEGKMIIAPESIEDKEHSLVLICSPQKEVIHQIKKFMDEQHINGCHIDEYIFGTHKEEIFKCFELLSDDWSKEIYLHLLKCRMEGSYPEEQYVNTTQYFCKKEFLKLNKNEVFVDCGAYVGDTIEKFIWAKYGVFKKIIAFEPDIHNFKAMQCRVKRLKKEWALSDESIEIFPCAVSVSDNGKGYTVQQDGLGTRVVCTEEDNDVQNMISLDQFLTENISFIKADIESYEYNMLLGSRECIKSNNPLLAISLYHNAVDFFSIPLLVYELCSEYRFAIAHHSYELYDTVLYAWKE